MLLTACLSIADVIELQPNSFEKMLLYGYRNGLTCVLYVLVGGNTIIIAKDCNQPRQFANLYVFFSCTKEPAFSNSDRLFNKPRQNILLLLQYITGTSPKG